MLKVDTNPGPAKPWSKIKALTGSIQLDSTPPTKHSKSFRFSRPDTGNNSLKQHTSLQESKHERVKIFIGTWNMFGKNPGVDLELFLTSLHSGKSNGTPVATRTPRSDVNKLAEHNFTQNDVIASPFLDSSTTHPYHLLAIGTQECERDISEALFYPSKEVWERRLCDHLGDQYQLLRCETMAALHLAVFVWKPVAAYAKNPHSADIKTGWANMVGNKGAVAISLDFGSQSLLFINCHLRAHQTKLAERNANLYRILHELQIKGGKSTYIRPADNILRMPSLKRLSRSYKSAKPSKSSKPTKTDESVDNVQLPSDHHNNASASNAKSSTKGTKAAETDGKALTDNKAASKMKNSATEKQSPTNTTADLAVTTNKRTSRDTKATKHRRDRMDERKQRSSSAPSSLAAEQHSVTEQFDHVFVFGDTNYRINAERGFVLNAIHKQDFETLLKYDQLTLERHRCNTPLAAFKEHPIHFIPTYKLDTFEPTTTTNSASSLPSTPPSATTKTTSSSSSLVITPTDSIHSSGTCSVRYDTSPKQRIPSWTDRILWHDRPPDHVEAAASIHRHTTTDSHPHSKSKLCLQWISALTRKNRNNILVNTETVDKSTVCYHYDTVMDPRLMGASDHLPVIGIFGVWFDDWAVCKRTKSIHSAKAPPWKKWLPS